MKQSVPSEKTHSLNFKPKGPSTLRLMMEVLSNKLNMVQIIHELIQQYGHVIKIPFGTVRGYFFNEPELLEYVTITNWKNFPKSRHYKTFQDLIGDSLLSANGERWAKRRTVAQPFFKANSINSYEPMIREVCQEMTDSITVNKTTNLYDFCSYLTFKIISRITYSNSADQYFHEFHQQMEYGSKIGAKKALNPFPFLNNVPLPNNIKYKKLAKSAHQLIDRIISNRINEKENNVKYNDLLQQFINSSDRLSLGKEFDLAELRNELITITVAGNETTALSLTWCLYELSKPQHQEQLKQLEKEILENIVIPKCEKWLDQLDKLPFLDRVIKETLRMYPAVWLVTREAENDEKVYGINVKKGETIILSPYFLHRNEKYWPEPERWFPDRFLNEYNKHAYIPFMLGPRHCIGNHLAIIELKCMLIQWVKEIKTFEIYSSEVVRPIGLINLYPSAPMQLKITERRIQHE